jgi:hypothetical protein
MQLITTQRVYLPVAVASVAVSAFTLASLFGRHQLRRTANLRPQTFIRRFDSDRRLI